MYFSKTNNTLYEVPIPSKLYIDDVEYDLTEDTVKLNITSEGKVKIKVIPEDYAYKEYEVTINANN